MQHLQKLIYLFKIKNFLPAEMVIKKVLNINYETIDACKYIAEVMRRNRA